MSPAAIDPANAVGLACVVGLASVVGAMLPLATYRLSVPAERAVRNSCGACGAALPTGAQGWFGIPARCSRCGARLGPPAWLTALLAAVSCGSVIAAVGLTPATPMFLGLCLLGVLLGAVDLACKRLPHDVVVSAIWLSGASFAVIGAVTGQWASLLRAVLGATCLGAALLVLYLLPGRGLGYGDVKLAVLLGLFLGWLGWREVLLGGTLPWLLNGPVALALLLSRRVNRTSSLPFGPALLAGSLLAVIVGSGLDLVGQP